MNQKTVTTFAAVVIGAASAGTIARKVENTDFDIAFMFSTIGLVIVGTIAVIKFAEWRHAKNANKPVPATNRTPF